MFKSMLALVAVVGLFGMAYAGDRPTGDSKNPSEGSAAAKASETFTGTVSATLTQKRPILTVGETKYELKASEKAEPGVAAKLEEISKGATGTCIVKGTRARVNEKDGILVDSITAAPARK